MANRHQIVTIESLRGVAAMMVVLYHLVELLKVPLPASLDVIRSHFGLGVPFFYLLSGFVLAYGYGDALGGRTEIVAFYVRRLFRIAPLFYAMLIVWTVSSWLVWGKVYSGQTYFLNFTFLYGLVPGYHESIVWAGWSIGVEMLFYLVFPVVACLLPGIVSSVVGFVVVCVLSAAVRNSFEAAGLGSYAYMNLGTHMPFFFAGVLCYRIWQRAGFVAHAGWGKLALLGGLGVAVVLVGWGGLHEFFVELRFGALERNIWAVAFGLILLSACFWANPLLDRGPLLQLGRFSFSVYLVHPFLMLILIKFRFVENLMSVVPHLWANFIVSVVMTVSLVWGVSALTYRTIESPGMRLGRQVALRIAKRRDA